MLLYIHKITGETFNIDGVDGTVKIIDIKTKLRDNEVALVKEQQLCFNSEILENDKTLSDYHIPCCAVIHLVVVRENFMPKPERPLPSISICEKLDDMKLSTYYTDF